MTSKRYIRLPNAEFVTVEANDALIIFKADGSEEVYVPEEEDDGALTPAAAKAYACAHFLSDPEALLDTLDELGIPCDLDDDDDADEG